MKKAIITGASSGLGYELSKQLIEKGIEVINLSRRDSDLDVINISTDLTKDKDINNAIKIIKKDHSDADVLILAAGVLHSGMVDNVMLDKVDTDFQINITGSIKLTNHLIPIINKNKGDVVVVGSTSSFVSHGNDSVYAATKHAVIGFIKALQTEYKKEKVRIIGFHPGGFKSELHKLANSGIPEDELMDTKDVAKLLLTTLELPRIMQISEIIIDRKKVNKV